MIFNKLITAVIGSLMILLISASATPIVAQALQAPSIVKFPADGSHIATLSASHVGPPYYEKLIRDTSIQWNWNTQTRVVLPGARVRFGPFKLGFVTTNELVTATYTIRVLAKSPAQLKTTPGLEEIGRASRTLSRASNLGKVEEDAYVTATLPGVLSAVQFVVTVTLGGTGPSVSETSYFPRKDCEEAGKDESCVLTAVNATGLLHLRYLPIGILYEPPGNCSYANLTQTRTAGASISVEETNAKATQTIRDMTVLDVSNAKLHKEHGDITEEQENAKGRTSLIKVSHGDQYGTRIGLPADNAGDPRCNMPGVEIPNDPKRGPGKGDIFLLLANWSEGATNASPLPLLYWYTGGMSNFRLQRENINPKIRTVSAWDLAYDKNLPYTPEERKAFLALNPFAPAYQPPTRPGLDPIITPNPTLDNIPIFPFGPFKKVELPKDRFVYVDSIPNDSPRIPRGQTHKSEETIISSERIWNAVTKQSSESSEKKDYAATLTAAATYAILEGSTGGSSPVGFEDLENGFNKVFGEEKTTTNVTIRYSHDKITERLKGTERTQNFLIQDTSRQTPLYVDVYFDKLFGTMAFVEIPVNVGKIQAPSALPYLHLPRAANSGAAIDQALPEQVISGLKSLGLHPETGSVRYEAALPNEYDVPKDFVKGLPSGMQFDPVQGKLSGTAAVSIGATFQALFYVKNVQGEKAAELWVTVQVNAPPLLAGAVDLVNCQTVSGRAWDKNNPRSIVKVDIFDGNRLLATVPANELWKNPLPIDPGSGNQLPGRGGNYHGFSYPIPDSLKDGRSHLITVRFAGTGTSLAGSPRTISINPAPVITDQPDDLLVCTGKPATLSVTASGADLHYQWYKDNAPIAGATGRSLTIAAVGAGDYGAYHVVISTGCSSVTSRSTTLTVNNAVAITSQPVSTGSCVGKPVTFSVGATGTNLLYQWRKDGGNISGATDSSYTIPSLSLSDAGSYSVVVYNGCSTVNSGNAVLTINDPIAITKQPASATVCLGQPVTFSVTATGTNLRYKWRKNGGNIPGPGAEGSSFTIPAASAADAASYSVVVYNGCSTIESARATLTVNTVSTLTLSAPGQSFNASGGAGSVGIAGCGAWTAVSNDNWITITSPTSGIGNGTVTYSVAANPTYYLRSGALTIGGKTFNLSQQPAQMANDSRFIIQNAPVTMVAGGRYNVSVTFRNMGSSTWTAANGYKLVSQAPLNNTTWGLNEVPFPSSVASVAPGADVTFSFTVTAPATAGRYRFDWRVTQGTVGFGGFTPGLEISVTQ
jgi:hypothetical protein